jgi:hypothetical protein
LDEQRELLKGFLATDLERAKHSLKLEQARLTFVYENQRASFTKVIRAMNAAITAIEKAFDYGDEEWRPIEDEVHAAFRAVRVSESLYTGNEGDRALTLFERSLSDCVLNRMDGGPIESTSFVTTCGNWPSFPFASRSSFGSAWVPQTETRCATYFGWKPSS